MKKKIIQRSLIGAPLGVAISYFITILISVTIGDGNFYPVVPQLITDCGGELNAVIIQALCSLVYGAVFAGSTVIWEKENWSILRMTVTHLIVISVSTLPIAYVMRWIPHNVIGFIIYCAVFFGIYFIIWITQYAFIKRQLNQLNKVVENKH